MSDKKDLLDEIFNLMHQQMQARKDGIAAGQRLEYERRAARIDELLKLLTEKRGEVLPYRPIHQAKPPERR